MAKKKEDKDDSKDKSGGKDKSSRKGKKGSGKKGAGNEESVPYSSIATHPKARGAVRRAKGWGGIGGFAIAAALSLSASVPIDQVGLRALGAGVAGYMIAWWASVQVWRHLMVAEQRAAMELLQKRRAERAEGSGTGAQPTG